MHTGKTMARLHAKPASWSIGSGGIPDMTAQDIAAALGTIGDSLGRELLCRVWWPDGAEHTEKHLADALTAMQRKEWIGREKAMQDALWLVASHTGGASLRRAQRKYADAHARRWPMWIADVDMAQESPGYGRVRVGVLTEISRPGLCHTCGGRGEVRQRGLVVTCSDCRGTGRRRISDRSRAQILGIDESTYRRGKWRDVYMWTLELCTDAMADADRAMRLALADE